MPRSTPMETSGWPKYFRKASRSQSTGEPFLKTFVSPKRMVTFAGSDRKSTRLNSSHVSISYAVFCLKKKKKKKKKKLTKKKITKYTQQQDKYEYITSTHA